MDNNAPIFEFDQTIMVHCITARSFPAGVQEAHKKIHELFDAAEGRRTFGISYSIGNNEIRYHAAVEALPGDQINHPDIDTFYIKKGKYIYVDIPNFMSNLPAVGQTFTELLRHPNLDPSGYCLEWYLSHHNLRCMVPLTEDVV